MTASPVFTRLHCGHALLDGSHALEAGDDATVT